MTVRGIPPPQYYRPNLYWEDRAQRFAGERDGLAAVCAYGMPEFYNRAIDSEQRRALAPWLKIAAGKRVLDVGCGVGRWSRLLAQRGAVVVGVDLSPTMIAEAQRRAMSGGVLERCRFQVGDLSSLELGEQFDFILGVTVLQHIIDPAALRRALLAMRAHLAPGGRMILLEAAPTGVAQHCDSTVFQARQRAEYMSLIQDCGLTISRMTGVDPAPFRRRLVPHVRTLPKRLAYALLAITTALSFPINAVFGRWSVKRSWHAVFIVEHAAAGVPP